MTYTTITTQREAAQAAINADSKAVQDLQAKAEPLRLQHERARDLHHAAGSGYKQAEAAANARNELRQVESRIEEARKRITKAQAEVERLDLMLNADAELQAVRAAWQAASNAQVERTREAQDARAYLQELEAAHAGELAKIDTAKAAANAAALAELGFGDKTDGTTAAAAAKALAAAEVKAEALREAIQTAHERIAAADAALLAADKPTREAEAAILRAKLHQAQRDHAEAYAIHLTALQRLHGAEFAVGRMGPRVTLYNDTTTVEADKFSRIAAELRELAEQGE